MRGKTGYKKPVVVLAVFLVLILGVSGFVFVLQNNPKNDYAGQIALGEKYLDNKQYDLAILAFQKAIDQNDTEIKPYLRLADTYMLMGKYDEAKVMLEVGFKRTGSQQMKLMLTKFDISGSDARVNEQNDEIKLNLSLLEAFANRTFDEQTNIYGEPQIKQQDESHIFIRYIGMNADFIFFNTNDDAYVINKNNGKPYGTKKPNEIHVDSLSLIFDEMLQIISLEQLEKLSLKNLKHSFNEDESKYYIEFSAGGCVVKIESDEQGNIQNGAYNSIIPCEDKENEDYPNRLGGRIQDAVSSGAVQGAALKFHLSGQNSGDFIAQTVSDENGKYNVKLPPGECKVEITKQGYITQVFEIYIHGDGHTKDFVISPELGMGEIRLVLSWGSEPQDLDSHLTGNASDGSSIWVSYWNRIQNDGDSKTVAKLDVDDTNGYGPETITISDIEGVFEYTVIDFRCTSTMASLGATVQIYTSNSEPIVVSVPSNVVNAWKVCRINKGNVEIINEATNDILER